MTRTPHHGYTLIELLVSLGIFSVVMLAATAAYLSFISYNRQAQATSTIIHSLAYSIDSMARDLRTGDRYTCSGGCPSGSTVGSTEQITFTDANNCTVTYATANSAIVRSEDSGTGCTVESNLPITDPGVVVQKLLFFVRGTTAGDPIQPMITLVISGYACVPNTDCAPGSAGRIPFNVQTGATQRIPDL